MLWDRCLASWQRQREREKKKTEQKHVKEGAEGSGWSGRNPTKMVLTRTGLQCRQSREQSVCGKASTSSAQDVRCGYLFLKFLRHRTFNIDYKWTHYLYSSLASGPNYPKLILFPDKDTGTGKLAIDLLGQSGESDEGKLNKQQRWAGQFGQWQLLRSIRFEIIPPSSLPPSLCHPPAESLPSAKSRCYTQRHWLQWHARFCFSVFQIFPFPASYSEDVNLLFMNILSWNWIFYYYSRFVVACL